MNIERLREIHDDASDEVYGGKLHFGHVSTKDFIEWVGTQRPIECCDKSFLPIAEFDILSVMGMFEDFIKGPRP